MIILTEWKDLPTCSRPGPHKSSASLPTGLVSLTVGPKKSVFVVKSTLVILVSTQSSDNRRDKPGVFELTLYTIISLINRGVISIYLVNLFVDCLWVGSSAVCCFTNVSDAYLCDSPITTLCQPKRQKPIVLLSQGVWTMSSRNTLSKLPLKRETTPHQIGFRVLHCHIHSISSSRIQGLLSSRTRAPTDHSCRFSASTRGHRTTLVETMCLASMTRCRGQIYHQKHMTDELRMRLKRFRSSRRHAGTKHRFDR